MQQISMQQISMLPTYCWIPRSLQGRLPREQGLTWRRPPIVYVKCCGKYPKRKSPNSKRHLEATISKSKSLKSLCGRNAIKKQNKQVSPAPVKHVTLHVALTSPLYPLPPVSKRDIISSHLDFKTEESQWPICTSTVPAKEMCMAEKTGSDPKFNTADASQGSQNSKFFPRVPQQSVQFSTYFITAKLAITLMPNYKGMSGRATHYW